jgi:hypothetical protein
MRHRNDAVNTDATHGTSPMGSMDTIARGRAFVLAFYYWLARVSRLFDNDRWRLAGRAAT